VLAAQVRDLHAGVGFLQHPDYLFFSEPRFLHDKVFSCGLDTNFTVGYFRGERSGRIQAHFIEPSNVFNFTINNGNP
jgi:hypothetical protein